jgi:ABC-type transport system involved in cytochrome c biogenesis permease subunit
LRIGAVAADILIGVLVLFPAGFIFNAEPQQLPPALQSWLFGPHVFVYILSYVLMTKAAVQAIITWHGLPRGTGFQPVKNSTDIPQTANRKNYSISFSAFSAPAPCSFSEAGGSAVNKRLPPEDATYRMVCAGFPLLTLGLILGSVWGQSAWGDWWGWDPKELWSLASWLIYLGYFHFRYMFAKKFPRLNSAWVILGLIVIIITLLWVNLSRLFPGLHSYAM